MGKKILFYAIAVALGVWLAKELTAERARGFIKECLSQDEIEIILDEPGNKEKQFEITRRTLGCVREKQSWPERIVTKTMGNRLFD